MNDVRSSRLAVWTVLLWAIFAVVWKTATKDTWGQTFVSWGLIGGLTSVSPEEGQIRDGFTFFVSLVLYSEVNHMKAAG